MDQLNCTTKQARGKHLSFEERVIIETRLKDGWNPNQIAKELGRPSNTVRNEIERGTVLLYNGKVKRYKASAGEAAYRENRARCHRPSEAMQKKPFLDWVEDKFHNEKWSLDSCAGRAVQNGEFTRDEIVCTKTLYNYVDAGLLNVKNIDLPEKLKRKPPKRHNHENKRIYGKSIEERPTEIETREEFGHWESDLVIGEKSNNDSALLVLAERKTRNYMMLRIPDKRPESVIEAFEQIRAQYSEHFGLVFKTITVDNGGEFSTLTSIESWADTVVYYAHPYSSWEKGSVERHNGLARRIIKKGRRIDDYTDDELSQAELWINGLPRRILGYKTPEELFDMELDLIYKTPA